MKIVIFGAAGSIGSFLAKKYFDSKHEILLFVKNKRSKKKLAKLLNLKNSENIFIDYLNLEEKKTIEKKLTKYSFFFKNSDLIINATGSLGEIKNILNTNIKKFEKTIKINLFSNLIILQKILKLKKKNKKLSIILFSGGGVTGYRKNFGAYSISKLALVKLAEIVSKEIDNKFIQINAIAPGIIKSKMTSITLKNRKLVAKDEIKKINQQIYNSDKSLDKLYKMINFLISKKGNKISGKLISSRWDNIENWSKKKIKKLYKSDLYSIRRVQ